MGFTLDTDEYERGVDLVTGQADSVPPIALQFEELLSELKSWEESSESDTDSDNEKLDDGAQGADSLQQDSSRISRISRRCLPQHSKQQRSKRVEVER